MQFRHRNEASAACLCGAGGRLLPRLARHDRRASCRRRPPSAEGVASGRVRCARRDERFALAGGNRAGFCRHGWQERDFRRRCGDRETAQRRTAGGKCGKGGCGEKTRMAVCVIWRRRCASEALCHGTQAPLFRRGCGRCELLSIIFGEAKRFSPRHLQAPRLHAGEGGSVGGGVRYDHARSAAAHRFCRRRQPPRRKGAACRDGGKGVAAA